MTTPYIIIGCPTTSGGRVISWNSIFLIDGFAIACAGDKAQLIPNIKQLLRLYLVIHTCKSLVKLPHESMILYYVIEIINYTRFSCSGKWQWIRIFCC